MNGRRSRRVLRWSVLAFLALATAAGLAYAFRPQPIPVDLAEVAGGPMIVTVDEDGKTRIRERYVISAPLSGRLRRIELDPGDAVVRDETIVAVIEPTDPSLLDARTLAEAEARVRAGEAALRLAGADLERARAEYDFAEAHVARIRRANEGSAATLHEVDEAERLQRASTEQFNAAKFRVEVARFELDLARSALIFSTPPAAPTPAGAEERPYQLTIRAPVTGRALTIFQESDAVVVPGTRLVEIGDPSDLEIVIDVLSTDAVAIEPGDDVMIEHWGGDSPLLARVRNVEPAAFTKFSALGVEEQRVNIIADFASPLDERDALGDGYRVEARIVLWRGEDVVQIPVSALFRAGEGRGGAAAGAWHVFVARAGRALLREVEVDRQNGLTAQVLGGIERGERVILHPGDKVTDGARIEARGPEGR